MTLPAARFLSTVTPTLLKSHLASSLLPLHLGESLTAHWAARSTWRIDDGLSAIRRAGEDKEVEIEVGKRGRGYLDPDFQRIHMGLGLFLDAFILGKIPSANPETLPTAYLAQSDLLDDPKLAADVPPLDVFKSGPQETMYRRTIWIGPRASFTPFHKDPYIGLYSQILGTKTFHVLPPSSSALLAPSTDPRHANTSTIPLPVSTLTSGDASAGQNEDIPEKMLAKARENLTSAFKLDGACRVTLQPGESVLVPEGWWHSAEGGNEAGVGVGAWFR